MIMLDGCDAGCNANRRFQRASLTRPPILDEAQHVMLVQSVITCPKCGTAKLETMPTDACRYFYEYTGCGASEPYPPIQVEAAARC